MSDNLPTDNDTAVASVPDAAQVPVQDQAAPAQPSAGSPLVPDGGESFPATQPVETISPAPPELPPQVEAPSQPPVKEVAAPPQPEPSIAPQAVAQDSPKHVVDKRAGKVSRGTPLKTTHSLTAEADEKEGDFIEHVEEIHSTGQK